MRIDTGLHLAAPEGKALYAQAAYSNAEKTRLTECIVEEILVLDGGTRGYNWAEQRFRISADNGRNWLRGPSIKEIAGLTGIVLSEIFLLNHTGYA